MLATMRSSSGLIPSIDGGWNLGLEGRKLTRLLLDFALTVEFWGGGHAVSQVRIEAPFDLELRGRTVRVHPEQQDELCAALSVLHSSVEQAAVTATGIL